MRIHNTKQIQFFFFIFGAFENVLVRKYVLGRER